MGDAIAKQLVRIVGVRFKRAGKVYYFDPGDLEPARGSRVLVETAGGVEFGEVVIPVKMVPESDVVPPIRPVLRQVVQEDYEQLVANREQEREAHAIATERIAARGLPMKLVNTEYTFDRNRLTFFFTADSRVDFRQLVRDLARQFGVRIELRQIGVRDQAKELGGIGMCGRELCCSSWLGEFQPVSIRMAKDQRLSLNPSKLTGQCGRLKCCLKFENDTYRQIRSELPEVGDRLQVVVAGETVAGRVIEVLVTKESVAVDVGEGRRVLVSSKHIENGEALVLTGKLARPGRYNGHGEPREPVALGHAAGAGEHAAAREASEPTESTDKGSPQGPGAVALDEWATAAVPEEDAISWDDSDEANAENRGGADPQDRDSAPGSVAVQPTDVDEGHERAVDEGPRGDGPVGDREGAPSHIKGAAVNQDGDGRRRRRRRRPRRKRRPEEGTT